MPSRRSRSEERDRKRKVQAKMSNNEKIENREVTKSNYGAQREVQRRGKRTVKKIEKVREWKG